MGSTRTHPEVAVVGGGVIGLASAWRLASRGATVVVIDPAPGRGASWAAAGMLAPVTEVHPGEEELLRLNLASASEYPAFVEELTAQTGVDLGYRRSGTLIVARDSDDNAALEDVYRYQQRLGLEVERLSGREARRREPALSPRTRGGIYVPGDHQIDNRALVGALLEACEKSGVRFVRTKVVAIARGPELALADGSLIGAGAVVVAAGAEASRIDGSTEEAGLPPLRPVKGQLLHLRARDPLLHGNVRGLETYLVGRSDGRLVVGATVEERGFDRRVTAGAVHELLRAAYELVPGITELELVETVAGLRPATPDNGPVIGRTDSPGVIVATGHYRNGVLLAPVTADAVARLVLDDEVADVIVSFSPKRFSREGSMP
jgi:glycine oxidase